MEKSLDFIKDRFTWSIPTIILSVVGFLFSINLILNHIYPKISYFHNFKISYIVLSTILAIISGITFFTMLTDIGSNKDVAVFYNKYRYIWECTLVGLFISIICNILISMATGMWWVLGASILIAAPYSMFIIIGHYAMAQSLATCGES